MLAPSLAGVIVASNTPAASSSLRRVEQRFSRSFPGEPTGVVTGLGLYNYDAMSSVVQALMEVHGDVGKDQSRLRSALASLTLEAPEGRIHLDHNHQAVTESYLLRIDPGAPVTHLRPVSVVQNVSQGFGGYLTRASEPSATGPACRRGPVPPWSR